MSPEYTNSVNTAFIQLFNKGTNRKYNAFLKKKYLGGCVIFYPKIHLISPI